MQTIDKKIDCIGSRKTCRYWKKGRKKKNLGTSEVRWQIEKKFDLIVTFVVLLPLNNASWTCIYENSHEIALQLF